MKVNMIVMLVLACAYLCFLPANVGAAELTLADYYSVDAFRERHPGQKQLMEKFEDIVRAAGSRVKLSQDKPVKIAFIYPGLQASDYWRRSVASFKGRMDEIGLKYELDEYFTRLTGDARAQEEQLRQALAKDPDYLVFTLYIGKHRRLVERLLTRGRPKVIMQNITTPLRAWEGNQPFLYVGFDHMVGTRMLADYYLQKTGTRGDYSVLYFSRGYISVMRGDSFVDYVEEHSERKLVDAYYTDSTRSSAKRAALEILNGRKVDFIYACSTDIALGGLDALQERGMVGDVLINGWGGGSAELDSIVKGALDVTVMRMNDDNGVAMAEAIRLDQEGRGSEVPTVYSGDFALVEKGIGKAQLDALIERAFRYSGVAN